MSLENSIEHVRMSATVFRREYLKTLTVQKDLKMVSRYYFAFLIGKKKEATKPSIPPSSSIKFASYRQILS